MCIILFTLIIIETFIHFTHANKNILLFKMKLINASSMNQLSTSKYSARSPFLMHVWSFQQEQCFWLGQLLLTLCSSKIERSRLSRLLFYLWFFQPEWHIFPFPFSLCSENQLEENFFHHRMTEINFKSEFVPWSLWSKTFPIPSMVLPLLATQYHRQ